jgi:translation elongation factor EF-Tu-like GTPase
MDRTFHIEAEIKFLTAAEGGKSKPARSGYRSQFHYGGRSWDAVHEYPDTPEAIPGQTVRALLSFLTPEEHRGHISVGMPFEIREGQRVVGRGTVTKLLAL